MSGAPSYIPHYTVADYEKWLGDWELWDGYAIAMSPAPNVVHQRVAGRLHIALSASLQDNQNCHCEVLYEVDWRIADDLVLRPDMVVVCETIDTPWLEKSPDLIIEILSSSTEKNDREYKRGKYAKHGVGFYLIVDPNTHTIEPLRLVNGVYQPARLDDITLHDGCAISLDPNSIWI